ncbi:MAG: hypothetical protein H0U27_05900, partial [Nitrosopumilus sp.]|nr:hypothetical protein [Nitrosopumilus sp.]
MANDYYNKGELKAAFEMIKRSSVETKIQAPFYVKLANAYFINGDLEKACTMIKSYGVETKIQAPFYVKLANAYFIKGDLENACTMIKGYGVDTKIQADFYVKLAAEYFRKKNYKVAAETIKSYGVEDDVKGPFLKKIVDAYMLDGRLSEACELIKDGSIAKDVRLKFVTPLLEKYEKEKDWKNLEIVAKGCDEAQKHQYLALIIEQNLLEETFEGKNIANKLIVDIFQTAFLFSGALKNLKNINFSSTLESMKEFPMNNIDSIGVKFLDGNPLNGVKYISGLVQEPSTIQYIVKYEV